MLFGSDGVEGKSVQVLCVLGFNFHYLARVNGGFGWGFGGTVVFSRVPLGKAHALHILPCNGWCSMRVHAFWHGAEHVFSMIVLSCPSVRALFVA